MRRLDAVTVAIGLVLLASGFAGGVIVRDAMSGSRSAPAQECTVGGAGDGASVTVTGPGAISACQSMTGGHSFMSILDQGTISGGAVSCQYHFAGLSYTVREQVITHTGTGWVAYGPITCDALQTLTGG